jgi:predicted  nucleic acid-binding Zn-ribbon protein
MATKIEIERLAVLEVKMTTVEEKLKTVETKVDNLPDELVKRLDEKYSARERTDQRLAEIEETLAPITRFRRNLWAKFIAFALSLAAIETAAFYLIKEWLKNK